MNARLTATALVTLSLTFSLSGSRPVSAAEQSWNGAISDSMCGASHAAMSTGGAKVSDRDCTLACVSYQTADAPKFVFVSDGKVYPIANQRFGGLARYIAVAPASWPHGVRTRTGPAGPCLVR